MDLICSYMTEFTPLRCDVLVVVLLTRAGTLPLFFVRAPAPMTRQPNPCAHPRPPSSPLQQASSVSSSSTHPTLALAPVSTPATSRRSSPALSPRPADSFPPPHSCARSVCSCSSLSDPPTLLLRPAGSHPAMTPEASLLRALLHFVLATYRFLQPSYDPPSSSARPTPTTAAGPASTLYTPVPTVFLASWPSVDLVELVWTPGHEKEKAVAVEKRQDGSSPRVTSTQVKVDGQQFMQTITVTSMCVLPALGGRTRE